MKHFLYGSLIFLFTMTSFIVNANSLVNTNETETIQSVRHAAARVLGLRVDWVKPAPITGLFEVMTERGIFYSNIDGKYIVRGNIFDTSQSFSNLTEQSMGAMRLDKVQDFKSSMIVYPAKKEKFKVTVFTDVDCGYCRKMHTQIEEYNALGITVQYMAFPRGGEGYPAWTSMQSLWCSDDQKKAMNELKAGSQIASHVCDNKVAEHYALGVEFGVTGTPSLLLNDGSLLVGYREPQNLLNLLSQ